MAIASSQLPPMSLQDHEGLHPFFDISSRTRRPVDSSTVPVNEQQANQSVSEEHDELNATRTEQDEELDSRFPPADHPFKPTDDDLSGSSHSRKRRKITPSAEEENSLWLDQLKSAANTDQTPQDDMAANPDLPLTSDSNLNVQDKSEVFFESNVITTKGNSGENGYSQEKPPKVLRLNGKGGLGSPPKGRQTRKARDEGLLKTSNSRGKKTKSLIVSFSYSSSENADQSVLSRKIERILNGEERFVQSPPQQPAVEPAAAPTISKGLNTSKSTHPFFLGKVEPKAHSNAAKAEGDGTGERDKSSDSLKSFSTPGKLRQQRSLMINAGKESAETKPEAPMFGSIIRMRTLGTNEALWPPKGMVHFGREMSFRQPVALSEAPLSIGPGIGTRKYKTRIACIPEEHDVISGLSKRVRSLYIAENARLSHHSQTLRLPTRIITSGPKLQESIENRLKSAPATSKIEKFTDSPPGQQQLRGTHPAISHISSSLATGLNAFDKGECESIEWAHKYAPKCAEHVLQPGKEPVALRSWLHGLTIDAVAGISGDAMARKLSNLKLEKLKRRRKKRRKVDELDDFIVGSDDDLSEMHELSDDVDELQFHKGLPKSVIRSDGGVEAKGRPLKAANMVLLSGPHGCGKTASVYAVANELGFEVFEINSSSRRNGKDVIDRVGDLAMNHQVRRKREFQDQDIASTGEALQEGRLEQPQSTMKSFFQTKSKPKPTQNPEKTKGGRQNGVDDKKKERRQQQQALILLEEVDVIFEEDRQFWETILDLAIQSRRPIIMTCNDEASVPLTDLSIHGIFRFRPAPADVAIDYMLLIAAAEGHLLEHEAVSALYKAKKNDLRSSLIELNFWCQMGVGDRKGGLEWYLKRWPVGCDIDEHGNTSRVVSESTYQTGMGWFGRDQCLDRDATRGNATEKLLEAWKEWSVEPLELSFSNSLSDDEKESTNATRDAYCTLKAYERGSDTLSAIDVACKVDLPFANLKDDVLDITQPLMTEQTRQDFPCFATLLDAPMQRDFQQIDTEISVAAISSLQRYMKRTRDLPIQEEVPETLEDKLRRTILGKTMEMSNVASKIEHALDSVLWDSSLSIGTTCRLAEDVAPFVRSIVSFDIALEKHRSALNGESITGKRSRNTRSSRSAMEGSLRANTRRERWFSKANSNLILSTAGKGWHHEGYASDNSLETSNEIGQFD